jgi:hypothetical protein
MRFEYHSGMLRPYDAAAQEFVRGLGRGGVAELELLHDRDMVAHRRILAQIGELASALHRDPERVRAELLFKTGNFQHLGELFGKVLISINSMSRRHMTDHELHAFWDDARQIIRAELLPQITDVEARERLMSSLFLEQRTPTDLQGSDDPAARSGDGV